MMARTALYRRWFLAPAIAVILFGSAGVYADGPQRIVILAPEHKTYQTAALACETALKEKGYLPKVINLPVETSVVAGSCGSCHSCPVASAPVSSSAASAPSSQKGLSSRPVGVASTALVIALGDQTALATLKNHPQGPVVFGMIPNILDVPIATGDEYKSRVAGVTADINPVDQLIWLRRMAPDIRQVCVPHSDRSVRTAVAIKEAGKKLGLSVSLIRTSKDDFARTVDDLTSRKCDAVLMIADAQIYNSVTIKRLLLWGIRQKRPVWAFSENFVKAGALGCLFTEPETIGRQTATVALKILSGTAPSKIGVVYPDPVKAAYNERTAKLIDLSPPFGALDDVTIFGHEE